MVEDIDISRPRDFFDDLSLPIVFFFYQRRSVRDLKEFSNVLVSRHPKLFLLVTMERSTRLLPVRTVRTWSCMLRSFLSRRDKPTLLFFHPHHQSSSLVPTFLESLASIIKVLGFFLMKGSSPLRQKSNSLSSFFFDQSVNSTDGAAMTLADDRLLFCVPPSWVPDALSPPLSRFIGTYNQFPGDLP